MTICIGGVTKLIKRTIIVRNLLKMHYNSAFLQYAKYNKMPIGDDFDI